MFPLYHTSIFITIQIQIHCQLTPVTYHETDDAECHQQLSIAGSFPDYGALLSLHGGWD